MRKILTTWVCSFKFYIMVYWQKGPKTKFGKIVFRAQFLFLTLKLQSVNSISLSFGKPVKRIINHFSRTLAQMAPLAKVCTLFLLFFGHWPTLTNPWDQKCEPGPKMTDRTFDCECLAHQSTITCFAAVPWKNRSRKKFLDKLHVKPKSHCIPFSCCRASLDVDL